MVIGLLIGLKFFAYCWVLTLAPRYLQVAPSSRFDFSAAWAAVRICLGLLFGWPIALVISSLQAAGLPLAIAYGIVMFSLRYFLWLLTARLLLLRHPLQGESRLHRWVLVGVCTSFALDGVGWLGGADDFKFFC